ncbi:hypothetical protein ABZ691_26945 [Streptomyces sp. NPDC006854]|uniref:hypothetical protein n=1 Tax=Streptomyces sp. NPDC006854 TaxID=3155115 RepID=UPI0033DBE4EA
MTATVTSIAPTTVDAFSTPAGAVVYVYEDPDGSLSSDCTGCGEFAWTLAVSRDFARVHAAECLRQPRRTRPLLLAA